MHFDILNFLLALVIGIGVGTVSSMLGIGGGIFYVPVGVLLFGLSQHVAQGTSLFVVSVSSISGALAHHKHGNVASNQLRFLLPFAIVGALMGSLLAFKISSAFLKVGFGLFLLYIALSIIWGTARLKFNQERR